MIVKDESVNLARCLRSIRNAVDRIVIGDTGSRDDTVSIARSYGAEVVSVPWENDFAAARNAVLRHSQCDWILVLDADEMVEASGAAELVRTAQQLGPAAYDVTRWNYVLETNSRSGEHGALQNPGVLPEASQCPAYVTTVNTRLFRRHPEVYFERPVHETVVYRLQRLRFPIARASFVIHHFGQVEDTKARRAEKNEIYYQIGLQHQEKNPNDARTCFALGLVKLEYFKDPEAALSFFRRVLKINQHDGGALTFAGICLTRMKKYDEALDLLLHAKELISQSIVLQESLGDVYFYRADYPLALASYRSAIQMGSTSALVLAKRGLCEIYCGWREAGVRSLEESLRKEPEFPELLDVVVAGAALAGNIVLAAELAQRRLSIAGTSEFHHALAATLHRLSAEVTMGGVDVI